MTARLRLALTLAVIGSACAREPSPAEPTPTPRTQPERDRAPLVTLEIGLVSEQARAQLAERHGPDSPLATAQAILAVHHQIAAPWHIYWKNPGESGLRTRLELSGSGFEAGAVLYPAPERFIALGGQVSYGWAGEVVLFVPLLELDGAAQIELRSDWLACHESCIPGSAALSVTTAELPTRDDESTRAMLARVPEPADDRLTVAWTGASVHVEAVEAARADLELLEFFPYAHAQARLESIELRAGSLDLRYHFDAQPPAEIGQGVLAIRQAGEPRWLELAAAWPSP